METEVLERVQSLHLSARQELSVLTGFVNAPMVLGVHSVTELSVQEIVEQRKDEAPATWCVIILLMHIVVLFWLIKSKLRKGLIFNHLHADSWPVRVYGRLGWI